jgi:ubiquinol-cytochrome c reductase cytochrome b subunit
VTVVPEPTLAHSEHEAPLRSLPGPLGLTYRWLDDRLGIDAVLAPVLTHPVPRSTNWFNVLGSATLTAFIFQLVTGVFLALSYVPAPNDAYQSLQYIVNDSLFGHFIRGIHYWGASAMILLIFAHTARVFLTGSYKYPRELNWILGVLLLFSTILMGFTGQLLVWNQDSYWAIVVGAEQAARTPFIGPWVADLLVAGRFIYASTLTHFYVIHVFLVPGLMMALIGGHLYLVVYQGISEWPEPSNVVDPKTYKERYHKLLKHGIPFFPDAMANDAIFGLFAGVVVIVLALIFGGAPLGHKADPTNVNTNPRPFWFLIWYFAFLAEIPPSVENIFIIGFPAVIITWMLLLPFIGGKGERAPSKRPWAVGAVVLAVLSFVILAYEGYASPWAPVFNAQGQTIKLPPALIAKMPNKQAKHGAQLFSQVACTACHSIDGVGGIRGPSLDNVMRDFRADPQRIRIQILYGGRGTSYQYMPGYATTLVNCTSSTQKCPLGKHPLRDILAFFRTLPGAESGVVVPHPTGRSPMLWPLGVIVVLLLMVIGIMWYARRIPSDLPPGVT